MAYRISPFFTMQGDRLGGWSENFWLNVTGELEALQAAEIFVTTLQGSKGDQAYCPRYRYSVVDKFRSGKTKLRTGAAPRSGDQYPADYATTKWLLRCTGATTRTTQWVGGMIDDSIARGGQLQRSFISQASWQAVVNQLVSAGAPWSIRVLDPNIAPKNILSIDNLTGIVTAPAHLLTTGDSVRIKGVRGLVAANGIWRIFVPSGSTDTFQLPNWVSTPQVMTRSNASVRRQSYIMERITAVEVVRSSNHKVGRPTGLHGGRPKRRKTA